MTMRKKPFYICFEGVEGSYKTTNAKQLADSLRRAGYTVLETKEPGQSHIQLTQLLRGIMLQNEYASDMTPLARELISQAIRSIHIEKLVAGADVDFIVQDRGTLSGKAYAESIGHAPLFIDLLTLKSTQALNSTSWNIYDKVILLVNDPAKGLALAKQKQEFDTGDAMEEMGAEFMRKVLDHMIFTTAGEKNVSHIFVEGKTREQLQSEILDSVYKSYTV